MLLGISHWLQTWKEIFFKVYDLFFSCSNLPDPCDARAVRFILTEEAVENIESQPMSNAEHQQKAVYDSVQAQ